jgi:uncharacterized protein (TIGR02996 family)
VTDDPERRAFLDAIREAPDDDAPRLIYADWLDERGEFERASLIRFQCALDPSKGREFTDFDLGAWRRLGFAPHAMARGSGEGVLVEGFDRGFIGGLSLHQPGAAETLGLTLAEEPIGRIGLALRGEDLGEFLGRVPQIRDGVHTLRLPVGFARPSGMLAGLEDVPGLEVGGFGWQTPAGHTLRIGQFPRARRLRCLGLELDQVRAAANACGDLTSLAVDIPNGWAAAFAARLPVPAGLEELELTAEAGSLAPLAEHLAPFAYCPIRSLSVGGAAGDDLLDWPALSGLERLTIRPVPIPQNQPAASRDGWLDELAALTPGLRSLTLGGWLRMSPLPAGAWPALESLELDGMTVDDVAGLFAASVPRLARLHLTARRRANYHELGAVARAAPDLRSLTLRGYHADAALKIANSGGFDRLEALDLMGVDGLCPEGLTPGHVSALAGGAFGPNLRALQLGRCRTRAVHEAAIREFAARCDAYWYHGSSQPEA